MRRSIDELPTKENPRFINPVKLALSEFYALNAQFVGKSWGSVVNDVCDLYKTADGHIVEAYGAQTMLPSYWTERAAR